MGITNRRLVVSLSILSAACMLFVACNKSIEGNYVYESDNPQLQSPLAGDSLLLSDDGTGIGLYSGEFRYEINSQHDSCFFYFDSIDGGPLVLSAKIRHSIFKGSYLELHSGGILRQFKYEVVEDSVSTDQLRARVLKGDVDAYTELYERLGCSALPYSILMANAYKNSQASYDVYQALIETSKCAEVEKTDSLTLDLAVHFLERSAQLDSSRYEMLGKLYFMGKYVKRDTIKAWECLCFAIEDQELRDRMWKIWHEWYVSPLEPAQGPMKEANR